ncbi:MAG: hypothetical protein Q8K61_13005 [Gallionella sp.]|nr:hypothetical protein [Gallionella sp.]
MELREIIESAEKAAGGQKALALRIGLGEANIRAAKCGARNLPTYACVMIADLIGMDRIAVIAASELVTEKKEERRAIWHPFVSHAASVILGAVIFNMTPTPAQAIQIQETAKNDCILCQIQEENYGEFAGL